MTITIKRRCSLAVISLLVALFSTTAHASECDFSQMGGTLIDFGTYSAGEQSAITGSTFVQFSCVNPIGLSTSYIASISTGSSGTFAARTLEFAGRTINYNLYTSALYTNIFGDGQVGTNTSVASGVCVNSQPCSVPVFGLIDSGQSLSSGQFTDELIMTLTF